MAAAGRNGSLAPHMRPFAPRQRFEWMGDSPPSLRMYFLGGLRVFLALKALLCSGNDASPQHWSVLRAIHTLNSCKNYIHLLGGLLPIHLMHLRGAPGIMWGTRGPFLPAAAMVGYGCVVDVGRCRLTSDQPTVGMVEIFYGINCFYSYVDPIYS